MLSIKDEHILFIFACLYNFMLSVKKILLILFFFSSLVCYSQICEIDSINYNHINCHGDSTGSISVTLLTPDSTYQKTHFWTKDGDTIANQTLSISNLSAGDYVLTIIANFVPGDPSTGIRESNLQGDTLGGAPMDTITIYETIEITAEFVFSNLCGLTDSADVTTVISGGTPPYTTLWNTGDTARNTSGLLQNTILPYTLTITDKNYCVSSIDTIVPAIYSMNLLMSYSSVECKDDNNGWAHVKVEKGTPPYIYDWSTEMARSAVSIDTSSIRNLESGKYTVVVTDSMGCIATDSVTIPSNPSMCLTIYEAFSPNDDFVNEFWEIKNIELYPEALILVYDRNGRQVYRRRNYQNNLTDAFLGKDSEGRKLSSGVYYYIIDLQDGSDPFKGVVTIIR